MLHPIYETCEIYEMLHFNTTMTNWIIEFNNFSFECTYFQAEQLPLYAHISSEKDRTTMTEMFLLAVENMNVKYECYISHIG